MIYTHDEFLAVYDEATEALHDRLRRGMLDEQIKPMLDNLNIMDRVVTLQSCHGHAGSDSARVWFCVEPGKYEAMLDLMPQIARIEGVEAARVLFVPWQKPPIFDVEWIPHDADFQAFTSVRDKISDMVLSLWEEE